ncbi:hypothetical protein [Paludibacterium yongneupense]|uniref:hypothetical protein n=1 Tax=Paludibacterium yongneupense TaxID=400061 RepID=UPI000423E139|nr:hypothetical protein [Paludibacterium yongneupense]
MTWPCLHARPDGGAILALLLALLAMMTLATLATVRTTLELRRLQFNQEGEMRHFYLAASALAQAERRVSELDRLLLELPLASRSRWFSRECTSEQAPPEWRDGLCLDVRGGDAWPPCRHSARVALFPGEAGDCRRPSSAFGPDPLFRVELVDAGGERADIARVYRISVRVRDRFGQITLQSYWQVGAATGGRSGWAVLP